MPHSPLPDAHPREMAPRVLLKAHSPHLQLQANNCPRGNCQEDPANTTPLGAAVPTFRMWSPPRACNRAARPPRGSDVGPPRPPSLRCCLPLCACESMPDRVCISMSVRRSVFTGMNVSGRGRESDSVSLWLELQLLSRKTVHRPTLEAVKHWGSCCASAASRVTHHLEARLLSPCPTTCGKSDAGTELPSSYGTAAYNPGPQCLWFLSNIPERERKH